MRTIGIFIGIVLTMSVWAQSLLRSPKKVGAIHETGLTAVELPLPLPGMLVEGRDTLLFPSDSVQPLERFFSLLDSLKAGKDTVLTIVHLGDSHIQRTNEPDDYFITSSVRDWIAGRCIQRKRKTSVGMGGIGVRSMSSSINLNVRIAPNNGAGYAFNQAILYRRYNAMPMLPTDESKKIAEASLADSVVYAGVKADTFRLSRMADTLLLHSTRRKQGTDLLLPASSFNNTYYGFSLTNGQPGILYHSIGVNGAMYVNYTDKEYLQRLSLLRPQLLIISLGTNETFGKNFSGLEFSEQVHRFLSLVKEVMPGTEIILTTPPECYKRTYVKKKRIYVRNENTEKAAAALRQIAQEEGIVCWDLFTATGGKNSCRKWQTQHLLSKDRIHFTQRGYQDQGVLLYRALMNAYNAHLRQRVINQPMEDKL